jgi:hypothetical protein
MKKLIAKLLHLIEGSAQDSLEAWAGCQLRVPPALAREASDRLLGLLLERADRNIELCQDLRHDAIALVKQGIEQVLRLKVTIAIPLGACLGGA